MWYIITADVKGIPFFRVNGSEFHLMCESLMNWARVYNVQSVFEVNITAFNDDKHVSESIVWRLRGYDDIVLPTINCIYRTIKDNININIKKHGIEKL